MSAPISLVIFDCDSVLVDTERIALRIDVVVLAALGWTMTEAEVIERFSSMTCERFPDSWYAPHRDGSSPAVALSGKLLI